jgi:ribosome-associated protein
MENEIKNDALDDIELVSKTLLKKESQEIQNLGKRLSTLSTEKLSQIPLDEPVLEAIALAHKIQNKRSALKRHYQFLGKLLRARDTEAIFAALAQLDQSSHSQIQRHHRAEHWRNEIITNGIDAIEACLSEQASADRQKLRQLWRNYSSAKTDARKTQLSRLIYKEIFQALGVCRT